MINEQTMRYHTKLLNGYKDMTVSCTLLGLITNVNESKYTADVYIPQANSNLYGVQIGTSMLGSEVSIDTLPSIDQKCLIAISAVHYPTIIAIIPNQRQETKRLLLSGEAKIGSPEAFMKLSKDKSIGFRTGKSALSIDSETIESIAFVNKHISPYIHSESGFGADNVGYEKTVFMEGPAIDAFMSKEKILINGEVNEEVKKSILSTNDSMIIGLNDMINKVYTFNETKDMLSQSILDDLEVLRLSLKQKYSASQKASVVSEYGSTDFNLKNDATLSVKGYNGEEISYTVMFKKDGTINIDCKDIIVNKTGGNQNA